MNFDLEYINKLAKLAKDNNLSEITLENEDKMISLRRGGIENSGCAVSAPQFSPPVTSQIVPSDKPAENKTKTEQSCKALKSPMSGTFYAAPSPDEAPFVNKGDNIAAGQVICIIEAMKLLNEIEAEFSGRISEILVKDGESVEAGQILMYVE